MHEPIFVFRFDLVLGVFSVLLCFFVAGIYLCQGGGFCVVLLGIGRGVVFSVSIRCFCG